MPCRRPVRVPTDQEKLTCNSHQFQESRRFVILIANLFFTSAAFFAPVILSRIRYPTAPVCKNVQSQNCELLTTLENITNLQYRMISDYTERVQRLQKGSCTSKLMIDVVNYILHHISELITVEKMAEALFMSRPYLSRKFKEETGESLTDFILYEKTEETKRLLRYSDKPITAISSYLGFSSPSHFPGCSKPVCALRRACTGKSTSGPAGLYFACAPSGKMILFTKKKITMEMPPLSTVVPML